MLVLYTVQCTVYMQTMCVLLTSAVAVGAGAVFMQMLCVLLTFAVKCDCKFWCCIQ